MDHTVHRVVRDTRSHENLEYERLSTAQGVDHHRIREFNRLLVLNYIREHGPIARVMLARRLGLSRTTVSSIMDALLQQKLVHEGHLLDATSRGGRRATLVHFNADAGRILGIDVGRTHLVMILTDLAPTIVAQRSVSFDTERGPEVCLPILISEIRTFVTASAVNWAAIVGIGVGIPGPLSANLHRLISPPHMPGWDNIDIWESLQAAFNKPLYIDNDANMGALAENRLGAGRGSADMAYVKIGTGIGGGLIINGHIYRGHQGSAGELGHLTIDENVHSASVGTAAAWKRWQPRALLLRMLSRGFRWLANFLLKARRSSRHPRWTVALMSILPMWSSLPGAVTPPVSPPWNARRNASGWRWPDW